MDREKKTRITVENYNNLQYNIYKICSDVRKIMDFKDILEKEMKLEQEYLTQYKKGLLDTEKYSKYGLSKKAENAYYAVLKESGKEKYLSRRRFYIVRNLRKRKLCETGVKVIERNLKVLERLIKDYRHYDPAALEENLPNAYRTKPEELAQEVEQNWNGNGQKFTQSENPHYPEHLKHRTSFGLIVRSRIEAAAAELAYSRGYYIMYEKRVILFDEEGNAHVVYPDFILCENENSPDVTWIYWEHLGRLDLEGYRERTMLKLKLFPENGIMPGRNLILTTDGMDESIDLMAVSNVLDSIENLEVRK